MKLNYFVFDKFIDFNVLFVFVLFGIFLNCFKNNVFFVNVVFIIENL